MLSPRFGPFSALIRPSSRKNRIESWTFGQISKLKVETRLTVLLIQRNYAIPLTALETMFLIVWAIFSSYKAWFKPIGSESLSFDQNFQLRLEIILISNNYA